MNSWDVMMGGIKIEQPLPIYELEQISTFILLNHDEPKLLFRLNKLFSLTFNLEYLFEDIVDPVNPKENLFTTVGLQISGVKSV